MNKYRFINDLNNDSNIIELDIYEYYDGLNVYLKRSDNREETYKVYYNEEEDNAKCLIDMEKIWYNNIKNIKNLKKLTIGSRFANELNIEDMVMPKNLEFLKVPSEYTLNPSTIIELLKNGCTVVVNYNDLFTDYSKPIHYEDFTEFKNADEFIHYMELLKIKEEEYKKETRQYFLKQNQEAAERKRIETEKEYNHVPGYNFRL